jgi:hypothetical protein
MKLFIMMRVSYMNDAKAHPLGSVFNVGFYPCPYDIPNEHRAQQGSFPAKPSLPVCAKTRAGDHQRVSPPHHLRQNFLGSLSSQPLASLPSETPKSTDIAVWLRLLR